MKISKTISRCSSALGLLVLMCGTSQAHEVVEQSVTNLTAKQTKSNHHVKHVKSKAFIALPRKANGADVAAEYRLEATPQLGQALTITLHMLGSTTSNYQVGVDSGLLLRSVSGNGVALANQKTVTSIVVVPQNEGLFYVNLYIEQDGKRSAVSIPVQVGISRGIAQKTMQVEANGEKVIVMPAK